MHDVYISVGSNIGERQQHIDTAQSALFLDDEIVLRTTARTIETAPLGGPSGQGPYLNTIWQVSTSYDASHLLEILLRVEKHAGRVRTVKNAPRTIDLDILFFDDAIITTEKLVVPHPRLHERAFVLQLLCEIAPDYVHPIFGKNVATLYKELCDAGCKNS